MTRAAGADRVMTWACRAGWAILAAGIASWLWAAVPKLQAIRAAERAATEMAEKSDAAPARKSDVPASFRLWLKLSD